jgi:hypothetical protein
MPRARHLPTLVSGDLSSISYALKQGKHHLPQIGLNAANFVLSAQL